MKLLFVTQAVLAILSSQVNGERLGESQRKFRQLQTYSQLRLPSVPNLGTPCAHFRGGNKIFLEDCSTNPNEWELRPGGLFYNTIAGRCLQAGHGAVLPHDGTYLRMKPCNSNQPFQQFQFSNSAAQQGDLTLQNDNSLCVTQTGARVNMGSDWLILKLCGALGNPRRNWQLTQSRPPPPPPPPPDGQLRARNGVAMSSGDENQNVYLAPFASKTHATSWTMDASGRVHDDFNSCLQAGHGQQTPAQLQDGTHMRVYPCDKQSDLQEFVIDNNGYFKLNANPNLCITCCGGNHPTPNQDYLIMKNCPVGFPFDGGRWYWELY